MLILTPLPGTKLYAQMEGEGRIRSNDYPGDSGYYTLTHPVADYKNFSWTELVGEVNLFIDTTPIRRSCGGCCGSPGTGPVSRHS